MKLPLPIYESVKIKEDGDFSIFVGLDKEHVEQLKKLSLDKSDVNLQKNTGDRKRFGEGSYEDWYLKNRTPFALIHNPTNALAALVWFGPKPLHEGCKCHAVGWRSYIPFRGKGIMKDFSKFCIDFYLEKIPGTGLWVLIKKGNTGSVVLAEVLGFKVDEKYSDDISIVMAKNV